MNGQAVWIWILAGLLAVVAVVVVWMATRSPREGEAAATAARVAASSNGDGALAGPVAGSGPEEVSVVVHPVEEPLPGSAELPPATASAEDVGTALPMDEADLDREASAAVKVEQVAIRDLFDHRDRYDGKTVIVRGKITTQCVRGCQFNLDDGSGVLFVELVGEALERVLPRGSVGKRIEVRGVFHAAPRPALLVEDRDGVLWK